MSWSCETICHRFGKNCFSKSNSEKEEAIDILIGNKIANKITKNPKSSHSKIIKR